MSDKTDRIEAELSAFLDDAKGSVALSENAREDVSRWRAYANRRTGELGLDASLGKISPAEHERQLDQLCDEVIGQVGKQMLPARLLTAAISGSNMTPEQYAVRAFRRGRS